MKTNFSVICVSTFLSSPYSMIVCYLLFFIYFFNGMRYVSLTASLILPIFYLKNIYLNHTRVCYGIPFNPDLDPDEFVTKLIFYLPSTIYGRLQSTNLDVSHGFSGDTLCAMRVQVINVGDRLSDGLNVCVRDG